MQALLDTGPAGYRLEARWHGGGASTEACTVGTRMVSTRSQSLAWEKDWTGSGT